MMEQLTSYERYLDRHKKEAEARTAFLTSNGKHERVLVEHDRGDVIITFHGKWSRVVGYAPTLEQIKTIVEAETGKEWDGVIIRHIWDEEYYLTYLVSKI